MKKLFFLISAICLLLTSCGTMSGSNDHQDAIDNAKAIWIATAEGDVSTLHRLTTEQFFDREYSYYTDDELRQILLDVPAHKRETLIDNINNHCDIVTHPGTDDAIMVVFTNDITNKEMTFRMVNDNGVWKVDDYWK